MFDFLTPVANHEALVTNALDTFSRAEKQMEDAITTIDVSIQQQQAEVARIQGQILGAEGSKSKLERVLVRVKAFTE